MIKATINKEKQSEYPKLMATKSQDVIILAYQEDESGRYLIGVGLVTKGTVKEPGEYVDSWDKAYFEDYPDEVILKNV